MRSIQRYLVMGLALTAAPITVITIVNAPLAQADCNYAGGSTVCAQGEVRGPDGVPRAATTGRSLSVRNDWYCGTDWDLDIGWDPGRPNRPWRRHRTTSLSNPMTRQPLHEGAKMLPSTRSAPRDWGSDRRRRHGRRTSVRCAATAAADEPPPPVPPPCTAAELAA